MTVTSINRDNIKDIIADMERALKSVGDKYGVDFSRKSARFTAGDFNIGFKCEVRNKKEGVLTSEEEQYNFNRVRYNLPELGFSYLSEVGGLTMTVVGWSNRARKYPVKLQGSDGRTYKTSVESLRGRK